MTQVVTVDFRARRVVQEELIPGGPEIPVTCVEPGFTEDERAFAVRTHADIKFAGSGPHAVELMRRAVETGDRATGYVFALADFEPDELKLGLRRQALKGGYLDELCNLLVRSDENMWSAQPHFVGAIVLEINGRLDMVREACPTLELPRFK